MPPQQAKISVYDHGFLYGDGVFEGIRAYNEVPFRLDRHLRRLEKSARAISLKMPVAIHALAKIVERSLKVNKLRDAYIRLLVTRGVGDLGLDPGACAKPGLVVIADKLALFPARCYSEGLEAVFAQTRRNIPEAIDPTIKSMNYLNNILAKIEAVKKRVPEAILLNNRGHVSECSGDNVFFVKGNSIVTPPVSAGVLEGITREAVMEIVRSKTRYEMREELFGPGSLFSADEVFFTGTAAEVIPVTRIDGRPIGDGKPGSVTVELIGHFRELIRIETTSRD